MENGAKEDVLSTEKTGTEDLNPKETSEGPEKPEDPGTSAPGGAEDDQQKERVPIVWTGRPKDPPAAAASSTGNAADTTDGATAAAAAAKPMQRLKPNAGFLLNLVADAERGNKRKCAEEATQVSLNVLGQVCPSSLDALHVCAAFHVWPLLLSRWSHICSRIALMLTSCTPISISRVVLCRVSLPCALAFCPSPITLKPSALPLVDTFSRAESSIQSALPGLAHPPMLTLAAGGGCGRAAAAGACGAGWGRCSGATGGAVSGAAAEARRLQRALAGGGRNLRLRAARRA